MKALKIFLTLSVISAWMIGCTKDFGETNTNPNAITSITTDLMLNPLVQECAMGQFNYNNGAALARYLSRTNYNEIEQYAWRTVNWSYSSLTNNQEMIRLAERDDKVSLKAVGYIIKAFSISQITDLWGDVPYFEAFRQGSDTPHYDLQKDIYTAEGGIISLLKEAERLFASGVDPLPSDIMYSGNLTKWRKLGNSLRLRYLMRISNRVSEITTYDIAREIAETVKLPLLETNSDNAMLAYLDAGPRNPIYPMRDGEFEYIRMSKESDERLQSLNDPRRTVWFAHTANSTAENPVYAGIPSGCSSTTLENLGFLVGPNTSMLGDYFRAKPDGFNAVWMNCSEVMFLVAEAIVKGYITGNAAEWYNKGITESFDYWCKTAPSAEYMAQPEVAFDANKGLAQIMLQKWIAQFFVGYEAWFDFKRTGLPEMEPLIDNRNPTRPGEIPSRFLYPESEQLLNMDNHSAAISRQAGGKDDINTKLWWHK